MGAGLINQWTSKYCTVCPYLNITVSHAKWNLKSY